MPTFSKIVNLGPWRRDHVTFGDDFLLSAKNVGPMSVGYRGGYLPTLLGDCTFGGAASTTNVATAACSRDYIYATMNGAAGTGKIWKSSTAKSGGTIPAAFSDITGASLWTGETIGTIAQYGQYLIFASLSDKPQKYDEVAFGVCADLITTTAPTGSSYATASFKARYAAPFRNHLLLANVTMLANYPSSNTIFSNAVNYGDVVWISMEDNIGRYATPSVHPEVTGSIPLPLRDDGGPITGLIGGEEAYVFKEQSIYRLVGPPFDAVRVAHGIGCLSPRSIVDVDGVIWFLSTKGVAFIANGQLQQVAPEMFGNAITNSFYNYINTQKWTGSSVTMIPSIKQTQTTMEQATGLYSDQLDAVVWLFPGTDQWIACNVNPPYAMSMGDAVAMGPSENQAQSMTFHAGARTPGAAYFTDTWSYNFIFGDVGANTQIGPERRSGCAVPEAPQQFCTPLMPLAVAQDGVHASQITGFRVIGEGKGKVTEWAVRSLHDWTDEGVIKEQTGARLQSRDGWVNTAHTTVYGRYHALAFTYAVDTYDIGETSFANVPQFHAIEIQYSSDVGRDA